MKLVVRYRDLDENGKLRRRLLRARRRHLDDAAMVASWRTAYNASEASRDAAMKALLDIISMNWPFAAETETATMKLVQLVDLRVVIDLLKSREHQRASR